MRLTTLIIAGYLAVAPAQAGFTPHDRGQTDPNQEVDLTRQFKAQSDREMLNGDGEGKPGKIPDTEHDSKPGTSGCQDDDDCKRIDDE